MLLSLLRGQEAGVKNDNVHSKYSLAVGILGGSLWGVA